MLMLELLFALGVLAFWYSGFWCGHKYGSLKNMVAKVKEMF